MILEYRTNNAYDSILAIDASGLCSSWTVTPDLVVEFCDCTNDPNDWDDQGGIDAEPEDYGTLISMRDGHALTQVDRQWGERIEFHLRNLDK